MNTGWKVSYPCETDRCTHVHPVCDEMGHITQGNACWCNPEVRWRDSETLEKYEAPLIIHNSLDMRELVEEAERIKAEASQ